MERIKFNSSLGCVRAKVHWSAILLLAGVVLSASCGVPTPSAKLGLWGVNGYYQQGKLALTGLHRDVNKGVVLLEEAARRDPLHEDVLTLLGRGYYAQRRYEDAQQMLNRALGVDREDEIAWIFLGLTQLRLGYDRQGFDAIKGGITLLSKKSKEGYRRHENWDADGDIRRAIGRTAFTVQKLGLDDKDKLLLAVERMIATVDDEAFRRELKRAEERTQ